MHNPAATNDNFKKVRFRVLHATLNVSSFQKKAHEKTQCGYLLGLEVLCFGLNYHLRPYCMYANSDCSDETIGACRLV